MTFWMVRKMVNTDNVYKINYQGDDIQKQLDYVNAIKETIKQNENGLISIDSLNTITLTTNSLTANTLSINSTINAENATATFNNINASGFYVNKSNLTDNGLTTNAINVTNDGINQTYLASNSIRTENLYLGSSNGSAKIGYWSQENSATGGQIYGLVISSPINFDTDITTPNSLKIKNINTTLELPDENDPLKNTTTYSFGKIAHQINYVSSLENFISITKDENNSSISRLNLNNINTITTNTITGSSASFGNIYSNGTTTLSALNVLQINSDALIMSEYSYATMPTTTINNLTINSRVEANEATATFNDVNASTLSTISATFDNVDTTNASVSNLNVDTITAPAYNYVSAYQSIIENIEINNTTYTNYNGMLLITNSSGNLTITLNNNIAGNMEFEVLRFGAGAVNVSSDNNNIIANEKLTSTAQIEKQYDIVGIKNFIINDTMYWIITGNVSV